jgi:hypothetical protein
MLSTTLVQRGAENQPEHHNTEMPANLTLHG